MKIGPRYPSIPHLVGSNKLDPDDLIVNAKFPLIGYAQEKIDGANCGVAWNNGPFLRNRDHVLHKGYPAKTPAKRQFLNAWHWVHEHERDLKQLGWADRGVRGVDVRRALIAL